MIDGGASMDYVVCVSGYSPPGCGGRLNETNRAPAWGTPVTQNARPCVSFDTTTCRGAPLRGFSVSADRRVRVVCGGRNVLPHAKALPGVPAPVTPSYGTDGASRVDSALSPGACGTAALATARNGTIAYDGEGYGRPRPEGPNGGRCGWPPLSGSVGIRVSASGYRGRCIDGARLCLQQTDGRG